MKVKKTNNQSEKTPVIKRKKVYGINFSEFELNSIKMICDYLFLDRFSDSATFVRFEQCFGLLFSQKNKQFNLVEAFKEIVGPKKKYLTFKRMIKAYLCWKMKKSNNYSFNYFMNEVFKKMLKKKGETVGQIVEGERFFSTRNCRNRKIITKFSVLTDENKNQIKGFILEYDSVVKAILCTKETEEDINLEINFDLYNSESKSQTDRDGISHIAGLYNETTGFIQLLIFKCRSGKTLYIGDSKEEENDKIIPFIFGSSKCHVKKLHVGIMNDTLAFIEPKFQLSSRNNKNLEIDIDIFDEKFVENDEFKNEENDYKDLPIEEFKDDKKYLFPLVRDDQFIDKNILTESIPGKNIKELYTSFFDKE